ncbi:magnesium transporter [Zavarzinia compransoris]|uniref:Magnesium transporter MgtE n=1 Tax=Zavarzinia compransoris TaxID=1264899 RepID=A0A317DTL1_9PROT|nr:magnesium transporter [Zavarzinia compransoris]PWR18028.1 magnesium transporter [Zavarzinia compransoris]TDP43505.1 magnesium transporter [Zavarzinia compransoris]
MGEPLARETVEDRQVGLDDQQRTAVIAALDDGDREALRAALGDIHVADLADLIEQLSHEQRRSLIESQGSDLDPELLSELHGPVLAEVLDLIGPREAAAALAQMDSDDAVYVLNEFDDDQQREVLAELAPAERQALQASLAFPEDSAGRLMQRDVVAVPDYWTIGRVLQYLRGEADLPDRFYEIVVVDGENRPVGTVPLDRMLRTHADLAVGLIMGKAEHLVPVDMDQEEVAFLFQQYRLVSAAVVDREGRLAGVITADDIADVIEEEVEEDAMLLGGVAETDIQESVWDTIRLRFTWLFVNLGNAFLAASVIGLFDGTIEKIVALAVLMPIVASMGGNAATQPLTVAVRTLATKELTTANARRVVLKEFWVGAINGSVFALIVGIIGFGWFGDWELGLVLGCAMVINMMVAALVGVLVPIGLDRVGVDPAIASGVFVTTVTDVVGFLAFLGLATLLLL